MADNEQLSAGEALRAIPETMRAVTAAMEAQTREIQTLASKMDDVHTRVVRLEEQRHGRDIERLSKSMESFNTRLLALEFSRAQVIGAGTFLGLAKTWFPIAALAIVIFLQYAGFELKAKP